MTTITSIDAQFTQSQIKKSSSAISESAANLSSGTKLNANVADLSVGTVLKTRVATLKTTVINAGQGKSLLNTAKGALETIGELLQKQKSLAVKAADDSLTSNERGFLNQEFQAIVTEIDRISDNTNFNGKNLLDGSISGSSTLTSATGLATENYSLITNSTFEATGTIATGDLVASTGKRNENLLTFGTSQNGTSVITIATAEVDGGTPATLTIGFTSTAGTAAASATAFVTAANAETSDLAQAFEFVDNGNGTVSVISTQIGTAFNAYTFELTTSASLASLVLGNNGTTTSVVGNDIAFSTNTNTNVTGTNGILRTIDTNTVGQTYGQGVIVFGAYGTAASSAVTFTVTDADGSTTAAITFTGATSATATANAQLFIEAANASTSALVRNFVFESVDGEVFFKTADKGNHANQIHFQITDGTAATELGTANTLIGTGVATTARALEDSLGSQVIAGTDRTVALADVTYDENLLGALTNFKATFQQASAVDGNGTGRHSVIFTVDVNGTTYTSQAVQLRGDDNDGDFDDGGNIIAANQDIIFFDPNGPQDSTGDYTDNAFALKVGTSDITLAAFTNAATAQASLDTIATNLQTQIDSVSFVQGRSISFDQINASSSDHRASGAVGTILEGLVGFDSVGSNITAYNEGDVKLYSDAYSSTGTQGSIGKFTVDRLTDTITTTVDGVTYTAYLNSSNAPTLGGVQAYGTDDSGFTNDGSYNATTKVITLDNGNTGSNAKLIFYSESTTDGKRLEIDLGNVKSNTAQINIDSDEGELGLETALNAVFGVSANDSLSFQVGVEATDSIGISVSSSKTDTIYKDDNGVAQTLNVLTLANAQSASDVLDNAINTNVSLIADVQAALTTFDSAINNNLASIQNADAARSQLLDTDFSQESTLFAEATVKQDAAVSILTQLNARIENLLQLLR